MTVDSQLKTDGVVNLQPKVVRGGPCGNSFSRRIQLRTQQILAAVADTLLLLGIWRWPWRDSVHNLGMVFFRRPSSRGCIQVTKCQILVRSGTRAMFVCIQHNNNYSHQLIQNLTFALPMASGHKVSGLI